MTFQGEGKETEPPRRAEDTSAAGGFPHACDGCGTPDSLNWAPAFGVWLCPACCERRASDVLDNMPRQLPATLWQA